MRRNDAGCEELLAEPRPRRPDAHHRPVEEGDQRREQRRWRTIAGLASLVGVLSLGLAGLWVSLVMRENARRVGKAHTVDQALLMARQHEKGGDPRVAIKELESAKARLDPADDVLLKRLEPELQSLTERLKQSERLTEEVRRHLERGHQFQLEASYDKAIAEFNEALRLDPGNSSAYYGRGLTWLRKRDHDYDKAIANFDEVLKIDPKNPEATVTAAEPGTLRRSTTRPSPTMTWPSGSPRSGPTPTVTADSPGTRRSTTRPSPTSTRSSRSSRKRPGLRLPRKRLALEGGVRQGHRRLRRGPQDRLEEPRCLR